MDVLSGKAKILSAELKKAFEAGYKLGLKEGVSAFAIWKDGVQYVGCQVYTLQDALQMIEEKKLGDSWDKLK